MNWITNLLSGGAVKSIENIAKEWIDTPEEKAKASSLMLKTLDPNGMMRRNISAKVSTMYIIYLSVVMVMVITQSYGLGDIEGTKLAIDSLTDLFVPITTMFTMIVSASFGVNLSNTIKGS